MSKGPNNFHKRDQISNSGFLDNWDEYNNSRKSASNLSKSMQVVEGQGFPWSRGTLQVSFFNHLKLVFLVYFIFDYTML
jgi:hypothetical protein